MNRRLMLGLLALLLIALALRCPQLGERPMHNDEAVNAIKFRALWEQGRYRYDPNEHHGPTLFYSTWLCSRLTGAPDFAHFNETRLRAVAVLFSVGLILLLPLVADGLGRNATIFAGLFTAISPALAYYGRDYIHETLLVFFTFLMLAGSWRYYVSRRAGWAVLAGVSVGLMQATKETFVLSLAAAVIGLLAARFPAGRPDTKHAGAVPSLNFKHVGMAAGAWCLVGLLFFSSLFTNATGPFDAFTTYLPWLNRGLGNSAHIHPWHFYLDRLLYFHVKAGPVWTEGLIAALAVIGFIVGCSRRPPAGVRPGFLRFLGYYTLVLTIIYSALPYKTPWCLLGFWHGAILLAGAGAAAMFQGWPWPGLKTVARIGLFAAVLQLAWQAWRTATTYSADRRNPFVYAQTSIDVLKLADEIDSLAQADPAGRHLVVKVMAPGSDYWPLPWYLRAFDRVGWWSDPAMAGPADPSAAITITSTRFNQGFETNGTAVSVGIFELRPDNFVELYAQSNLWQAYLNSKPKERESGR